MEQVEGTKQSPKETFGWYLKAAENGDAGAAFFLAEIYDGRGEDASEFALPNVSEAIKWYKVGASGGIAEAQAALAEHYHDGNGVKKDIPLSLELWQKASENGDAAASITLGDIYVNGFDPPRDYHKALAWYLTASRQGDPYGGLRIAETYSALDDDQQALAWYEKEEASFHSPRDQTRLADFYANGRGTAQSDANAAQWYEKAALQGDFVAQYRLGLQYAEGKGVPKDVVMAYFLFTLSMNGGNPLVQQSTGVPWPYQSPFYELGIRDRDQIAMTMSADQIPEAEAFVAGWRQGQPLPVRPK
jgi:TPR repeat protein